MIIFYQKTRLKTKSKSHPGKNYHWLFGSSPPPPTGHDFLVSLVPQRSRFIIFTENLALALFKLYILFSTTHSLALYILFSHDLIKLSNEWMNELRIAKINQKSTLQNGWPFLFFQSDSKNHTYIESFFLESIFK